MQGEENEEWLNTILYTHNQKYIVQTLIHPYTFNRSRDRSKYSVTKWGLTSNFKADVNIFSNSG